MVVLFSHAFARIDPVHLWCGSPQDDHIGVEITLKCARVQWAGSTLRIESLADEVVHQLLALKGVLFDHEQPSAGRGRRHGWDLHRPVNQGGSPTHFKNVSNIFLAVSISSRGFTFMKKCGEASFWYWCVMLCDVLVLILCISISTY